MSGYWKLWHDVRGRFLIACMIVGWQIYATSHVIGVSHVFATGRLERPAVCQPAGRGEPSAATRLAQLQEVSRNRLPGRDVRAATIAHDYKVQASYCAADERPTPNYGLSARDWVTNYSDSVWGGMMPILMLFMGVLISVGPPFSGESNEASSLTFSLPWSRGRWLKERAKLSAGLVLVMIAPAYVWGHAVTIMPAVSAMYGWTYVTPLGIAETLPALMTGMVGIALGISATMLTRNALVGAVAAAISAYVLVLFDFGTLTSTGRYTGAHLTLLDLGKSSGILVAFAVIIGAIALSYVRLQRTDF